DINVVAETTGDGVTEDFVRQQRNVDFHRIEQGQDLSLVIGAVRRYHNVLELDFKIFNFRLAGQNLLIRQLAFDQIFAEVKDRVIELKHQVLVSVKHLHSLTVARQNFSAVVRVWNRYRR